MKLTDDPFSIIQAVTASGVIVWDAIDEEIIAANQTAAQILGLPLRTLLRFAVCRRRLTLLRPDGTPLAWEDWPSARALRTGQAQRQVLVGVASPDGQRRDVCVDAVPVRWRQDEGPVRWVVVSFRDVSEQADAERPV